jgi:hypothetical protein
MKRSQQHRWQSRPAEARNGAAAVEFALIAPLFLSLLLGVAEMGRALDVAQNLTAAIREGGRLAAMDFSKSVPSGSTANQKVTQDIRNMLTAAGIDGDLVDIAITHADGPLAGQPYDLQEHKHDLLLFRITAQVNYSDVSFFPLRIMDGRTVTSSLVFRQGRSQMTL